MRSKTNAGAPAGERIHPAAQLRAEVPFNLIRIRFEARIDLAAVAARCAPAGFFGFEHHDLGALLARDAAPSTTP